MKKWQRVFVSTGGIFLFAAGAALASNSGIAPLDTVLNDGVLAVAGAATLGTSAGFLSALGHVRGGDYGTAASHGFMSVLCGSGAWGAATYCPALGGVAAALAHPIVHHAPLALSIIQRLIG